MSGNLDRNGYAPSIISGHDEQICWWCLQNGNGKMDRHEVFFGANREKSKRFGLWVHLCHDRCHLNGVHGDKRIIDKMLKQEAQFCAMREYDWTVEDFIFEFGKNYVEDYEC